MHSLLVKELESKDGTRSQVEDAPISQLDRSIALHS